MKKYDFVKTRDGSIGLYNNEVKDIYHSGHGALQEAIQKFIMHSGFFEFIKNNNEVSILDICYGIGYNSKAAFYLAKKNNKSIKIKIDALDNDEELILISPFIKDLIPSLDLKLFIIFQILKNEPDYLSKINEILKGHLKDMSVNLCPFISYLTNFMLETGSFCTWRAQNRQSLHNIYYQYISTSMKNDLKSSLFKDSVLNFYIGDARLSLQTLSNKYDFIFLDAFTPQKDPTLWTYDFIKLLKSKMHENSVLITYSNSTPFRSALLKLGLYVGKVLINEKQFGTVASLNQSKIIFPLDEYDISLTKTKSGILFRDKSLSKSSKIILKNHKTEQENSNRITTSKFIKKYKST